MATYEGRILAVVGRTFLFQSHYWHGPIFLPISQVTVEPDGEMDCVIHLKDWLARKNDIPEFTELTQEEVDKRNEF